MSSHTIGVLFVCMGNICRSPAAEGVFRKRVAQENLTAKFKIDSAGTHAYHVGSPPDKRARQTAARRAISLDHLRARLVTSEDFAAFDYVLAMDHANYAHLQALSPEQYRQRLHMLLSFVPQADGLEVPDPYYGGINGFEHVLDLVEAAAEGLLQSIREQHRI